MKLMQLAKLLLNENEAENYLREVGILKDFKKCIQCNSESIGRIRRGRYKCYKCFSEWGIRKDSLLENSNLKFSEFIGLIKLFELEIPAEESADLLGISAKSAKRMFVRIRLKIANITQEYYDSISKTISKESDPYVIIFEGESIYVDLKSNVNTSFAAEFQALRSRVPNHEATYLLSFRNFALLRKKYKFPSRIELFWRFAKDRIRKFRGTNQKNLFLFLKEIELRYNTEKDKLFNALIENLGYLS